VIAAVAERPKPAAAPAWQVIERGSAAYAPALLALGDAPARVWCAGAEVPAAGALVAIVGSRAASPYGRERARALARSLASLGLGVASGLARGVDAEAHEGALAAGGRTVAVLPGPPEAITPPEHAGLAARVAARGTLLTEVPPGAALTRARFARRNRLIAALACVTVVVEAGETSGALITAAHARRLGRPVLAVPGDVDRPTARGTLALLRGGARPCGDASDVLAALAEGVPAPVRGTRLAIVPRAADDTPERRVLAAMAGGVTTVDEIAVRARLEPGAVLAALLGLEWNGLVRREPGGRWREGRA
jgi:DNA processing protein